MKRIYHILLMMLPMFFIFPQIIFAQERDDLQEYLDQLAASAESRRVARTAIPLATETEIDLSRFSSYKNRTTSLTFAASLNVRITNGTITAASNYSGGAPLLKVQGVVTLDATAGVDASGVSSSVCPAAVGVVGSGTFNQYAAVLAPQGGEKVTLESANCTWNNYFDVVDPDFEGSDCLEYSYDITNKTAEVKRYSSTKYSGDIVIPKKVKYNGETYSVTSISSSAFDYCSSLTSITIPNSVTSIGSSAFYSCSSLTSITIPNSVISIGNRLLSYCTSLASIVVEKGNAKYDSRDNCNAIVETSSNILISGCKDTYIPHSVTSIGSSAFYGCTSLTSISIPNSVVSIGDFAFRICTSLTSVTIPNSVTSIGELPFSLCNSLTSIIVDEGNVKYDSRDNCNAIIETSSNTLITGCKNTVIPNSVTSIGSYAFMGSNLTSITIPNSVTSIDNFAFSRLSSLTDVTNYATTPQTITSNVFDTYGTLHVPAGCKAAYEAADNWKNFTIVEMVDPDFVGTEGLLYYYFSGTKTASVRGISNTSYSGALVIPSKVRYNDEVYDVTSIENNAFKQCTSITSVTIPEGVTRVGESAFADCSALVTVDMPESVKVIGKNAFYYCEKLSSISVPNSVDDVGSAAFYGCKSLPVENNLRYAGCVLVGAVNKNLSTYAIRVGTKFIEECAFQECENLTSITIPDGVVALRMYAFNGCTSLQSIVLPEGVSSLGFAVFEDCYSLRSVSLPTTLKSWGVQCFNGCHQLTSVVIPEKITAIGSNAFKNCWALTSVTIPSGVTSIANCAFEGCSKLSNVTVYATTPPTVYDKTFSTYGTLLVPYGSKAAYKAADYWKNFTIEEMDNPNDFIGSDCLTYTYDSANKTATVSGVTDKTYEGDIVIPAKVRNGSEVYKVTGIDNAAFSDCASIASISIPAYVSAISNNAFNGTVALEKFTVDADNSSYAAIGSVLFSKDGKTLVKYPAALSDVYTVPAAVTDICPNAFMESELTTLTVQTSTPPTINSFTFNDYCYENTNVVIPASAIASYVEDRNWNLFKSIREYFSLADVSAKLAAANTLLTAAKGDVARMKGVYGEVKPLLSVDQICELDAYFTEAEAVCENFEGTSEEIAAGVEVATTYEYYPLYVSACNLYSAIYTFSTGLASYEVTMTGNLISNGQTALTNKMTVLKQNIENLVSAVGTLKTNTAAAKQRCGTDFFMVDPSVLESEMTKAYEASLAQLDADVTAAKNYWNTNFSYVEITTIAELKAFLAKADALEEMVNGSGEMKVNVDNQYNLFVQGIDEADVVLPIDGTNYSLQTASIADKLTPDGFPIQMGYKSNRGSVLTSAGLMQFERASAHTFYLKDDQSNYMILLGEDAAMLGIPSSDGATEWVGQALGDGKYTIKVAGDDFGELYLNILGTRVNSEVVASQSSVEWTIKESELDELQAFLNMLSEENYTDEELAAMDDDEKKAAEEELVYVIPKPLTGEVHPYTLPKRPGVVRIKGYLPIPNRDGNKWGSNEHPIVVPDGSRLVLDDIKFDGPNIGGDHVINVTGEVTVNVTVDISDEWLKLWEWFIKLGKDGKLFWHPGGHHPNIKNDEGHVYIQPGGTTGKIDNTGQVTIAADDDILVDQIENNKGGTVNHNGGRVIKIVNKYVYVFAGGFIDNCDNGESGNFTMTGGRLGNTDENYKDIVFVNHGKFIFRGGWVGGYGSHLFYHHPGAYLRIEGGDIDDSHVTNFIEAYEDFYMSGGFKPYKPIVLNPGIRIHVITDIKYIWNIQFVGGVLPDIRMPFLVGTKLHPLSLIDWRRIGYLLPKHYRWRFRPSYKFIDDDGTGNGEEIETGALEIADENVEDEDDLQAYLDWLASQEEDASETGEVTDYDYSDTEEEPAVMNLPEDVIYITKYIYIPVGHHVHFNGGEIRPKTHFDGPIFRVPSGGWMHTTDLVINIFDIHADWNIFNIDGYFRFGKGTWLKGWRPTRGYYYDGALHGHIINVDPSSHLVLDGGRIDNVVFNLKTNIYFNVTLTYNVFVHLDASVLSKGYQIVKPYIGHGALSISDAALIINPDRNFPWSFGLDASGCVALYDKITNYSRQYDVPEGWSWMSFGIPAESDFMKSFAGKAADYSGSLVRIQDATSELFDDATFGFVGGLQSLSPEVGYHVYADNAFGMDVTSDSQLMTEDVTVSMKKGWNWIGYTPQVALPVEVAMSSMTPSEGDLVKSYGGGFAVYNNGAWVGNLTIQPGEGLMYQAKADVTMNYIPTRPVVNEYVASDVRKMRRASDEILPADWQTPVGLYEMNMSIIADVYDADGSPIGTEGLIIAAFCGNQCRGVCYGSNGDKLFMTVYGDSEQKELLNFVVFDTKQNLVYKVNEKVIFGNVLVGTPDSPMRLTMSAVATPVDGVQGGDDKNVVYSLAGLRMSRGKTDLRSLPRGVYISNGKKILVR